MTRLYALLLYLYPPSFRRAHGHDMLQMLRTLRRRGEIGRMRLAVDLARSVPREWLDAARDRRRIAFARSAPRRSGGRSGGRQGGHRGEPMRNLLRDLAYAARLLRKGPGFTTAAVVTLALGIGANTAMFSLAEATLLRPLDVVAPERLVTVSWTSAYPDYLEYAQRTDVFDGVLAWSGGERVSVSVDGASELTRAAFISGNGFAVLGVHAAIGRTLLPSDAVVNGPVVGVLGHDHWRARFGSNPAVVGTAIRVNGRPVTIVGVAEDGFRGIALGSNPALYLPLTAVTQVSTGFFARPAVLASRGLVWLTVIGRLRTDVTAIQAAGALDARYRQLHPPDPGETPERMRMIPLATRARGGGNADAVRRFVLLLLGVVTLTLLVGCANLANLLLARSATRRREVGVRMAMGASRAHIARQMIVESLLLAAAGGAAGLAVAAIVLRLLAAYQLPGGIEIGQLRLSIDAWTMSATAALSLVTGLLFGVAPAWRASSTDVMVTLRGQGPGASPRSRLRGALVAAQVALCLVLLTGSGVFLRSLVHALAIPLGYDVNGVITASVNLGLARYDEGRARTFFAHALERVRALPHVTAAAWTNLIPSNGLMTGEMEVDGYRQPQAKALAFYLSQAGPEYFAAAGTRVIAGRAFAPSDDRSAPPVAVINQTAARKYWDGRNPIGGQIKPAGGKEWRTVVGVVEDAKVRRLDEEPVAYAYFPFDQSVGGPWGPLDSAHLVVRTDDDPRALAGLVAGQLRALDPDVPLFDVVPFAEHIRELVMPQRMGVTLFACFSLLALTLAAVGIYGVASYVAAMRTRELGIRMALGAGAPQIRRLVLRHGVVPALGGIAAGLGLAWWAGRFVRTFLYDVSPVDPLTFAAVAATLVAVTLAATWIPARRAARLDPMVALRHE